MPNPDQRIGIQGGEGSNSEVAVRQIVGHSHVTIVGNKTFSDVFQGLRNGEVDKAVLPISNTSMREPYVPGTYDVLTSSWKDDFFATRKTDVDVRHHLLGILGTDLSQITSVHSQDVALDQCKATIDSILPGVIQVAESDTALSAKMVHEANDPSKAAIATSRAGELYGLAVLDPNPRRGVQDYEDNRTSFLSLSRREEGMQALTGHEDRTLILVDPDDDDSLESIESITKAFRLHGLKGRLHTGSAPGVGERQSRFLIEAKVGYLSVPMDKTLRTLAKVTRAADVLGSWKEPVKPGVDERMVV